MVFDAEAGFGSVLDAFSQRLLPAAVQLDYKARCFLNPIPSYFNRSQFAALDKTKQAHSQLLLPAQRRRDGTNTRVPEQIIEGLLGAKTVARIAWIQEVMFQDCFTVGIRNAKNTIVGSAPQNGKLGSLGKAVLL